MIWLVFILLLVGACSFVLVPLLRKGETAPQTENPVLQANKKLYREKVAEFDRLQAVGEIDAVQRQELQTEAQKQLLRESVDPESAGECGPGTAVGPGPRLSLLLVSVVIAVSAVMLYQHLGAHDQVALTELLARRDELQSGSRDNGEQLQTLDQQLEKRLLILSERYPEELSYSLMLARLYQDQGSFPMAVVHLRRVVAASPPQPSLLAEYAQALFLASDNQFTGETRSIIEQVLALDPENTTVLGLQGIAAFQRSDFQVAIDSWERALSRTPPMSPGAEALRAGIANARQKLELPAGESPAAPVTGAAGNYSLQVEVRLAPDFNAPPTTPVFVYAREWQGAPMPVAIQRLTAADLPALVRLDETMTMTPALSLATVKKVELVARVALSGAARAVAGDLEGRIGPIEPGVDGETLQLTVDTRLP